jgi:NADH-quinone oxidoreductase subunit C
VAEETGPREETGQQGEAGIEGPGVPDDPLRRPLLDLLQAELGDDLVGFELAGEDLWVRVERSAWYRAVELCRDRLGMTYFCFLSGLDWKPNPDLLGEKEWEGPGDVSPGAAAAEEDEEALAGQADEAAAAAEEESGRYATGVAGGDTRFQVFARLYNVQTRVGLTLKVDLPEEDTRLDSIVGLFRGADWHERETWEMYGFQFTGHPSLRHLYLPLEFEGHPLRKDFPLLARLVKPWPGLVDVEPMPGEPAGEGEAEEAAEEG